MDIKIGGYNNVGGTGGAGKKSGVSGTSSFADLLAANETETTAQAAPASDVAASAALNNLLALQEISEEDVKRKKLAQQGKNMLDSLEKLQRQLLMGQIPLHTLSDLRRQLMLQKQEVSDPRLHEIIDDIEMRSAIELAKLEMAALNLQS